MLSVLPGTVGERPRQWSHHGKSDRNQRHADEEPDFAASGWENLQTVTPYEKKIFALQYYNNRNRLNLSFCIIKSIL